VYLKESSPVTVSILRCTCRHGVAAHKCVSVCMYMCVFMCDYLKESSPVTVPILRCTCRHGVAAHKCACVCMYIWYVCVCVWLVEGILASDGANFAVHLQAWCSSTKVCVHVYVCVFVFVYNCKWFVYVCLRVSGRVLVWRGVWVCVRVCVLVETRFWPAA
jgi:hypothetical protein